MTLIAPRPRIAVPQPAGTAPATGISTATRYVIGGVRIAFGLTFLWAFVDKLFGLGYATPEARSWLNGGHPTQGFLKGSEGPFADFYHSIAGTAWADWLFMMGLLGIGLALTLGIGMRIAAAAGALLYVMMWSVVLPPPNNPVLDDHLLSAGVLVALAMLGAGAFVGLGRWWAATSLVRSLPWLK